MNPPRRPALAIMAREPSPGEVKTRFQPHLTPEESAKVYSAFLRDVIDLAVSMTSIYALFLAFSRPEEETFFKQMVPPSVGLLPQQGDDLGQRMYHLFLQLEASGYSPMVIIGSDIPTLQPSHLEKAVDSLSSSELCLGPTHDGGYYLIGARRAHRHLFQCVPWSTPQVLEATIAKAKAARLSVALLDQCSDVDTIDDLRRLRFEVERSRQARDAWVPRWTEACLKEISL